MFIGSGPGGADPQALELKRANRHGLIAGATGTGKTVTLRGIVDGLSAIGIPTFVADGTATVPYCVSRRLQCQELDVCR